MCGWEDDPLQAEEPDFEGGANDLSLHEAQIRLQEPGGRRSTEDR